MPSEGSPRSTKEIKKRSKKEVFLPSFFNIDFTSKIDTIKQLNYYSPIKGTKL